MTALRDITAEVEQIINDELGDEITYTFGAGGASLTFNAWVEFDTTILNPGNSSASTDEITVEVPMAVVPNPLAADTIVVTILPGMTWVMKKRVRSNTGATWVLGLKRPPQAALAGAVSAASSVSGTLWLDVLLSGAINAAASATGGIAADARLAGAVSGASVAAGGPRFDALLSGAVAGTSAVSGALKGDARLAGAAAGASTVTGALTGTASLAGAVAGQSTISAAPRLWDPVIDLGAALLGFWDAERADLITLSGSSVTTWADIVGGYAPTQGVTGSKPVYASNSFNGRPGIAFDGTDDSLLLGSQPFPSGSAACEMWMLADQRALAADATVRIGFTYGAGGSATTRYSARTVVSSVNRAFANAGNGTAAVQVTDTAVDLSGKHVVRVTVSATTETVAVDGNTAVSTASVPNTGSANVRIGGTVAGSNFANMIANAILVTSSLTTTQAAQMVAFLKARGGIP